MATSTLKSALLVMDVQPGITDRLENHKPYLEKVQAVVDSAHAHGIPVIYVVVGFRPGFPEVSPNNKSFAALTTSARTNLTDPQPAITPLEGDVVVVKRRVSAFTGSDLEVILRAKGINHLVLSGIATSGVVLSTVREASDKDFALTVLSDACEDFDPQVHTVLLEKVFPRQADVVTSAKWIAVNAGEA